MTTIAANGLDFDALEWGSADDPTVVCLHGFPQRNTSFADVARRLVARGLHVVAPNQRGYSSGARPTEVGAYSLPNLVADVVALLDTIGGGAPVHLVGHDWGAVVGWQVVSRHPEVATTWTALSTPSPLAIAEVLARTDATGDEQRSRFRYMSTFRQEGVAEQALLADGGGGLARVYGDAVAPERVADDVAFFSEPGVLTAALSYYRAMERTDSVGLAPVTVPTTYVWGERDVAFGREAAEATGRFVSADYRFVAVGSGHWLPDEVPETVANAVAERVLDDRRAG